MANLMKYEDASIIRTATPEELKASEDAAKRDGGVGAITVDGVTCYVIDADRIPQDQVLTAEDVTEILETYVGATGQAKIQGSDLMIQAEENADWSYCGPVENEDEAQQAITEFFNR